MNLQLTITTGSFSSSPFSIRLKSFIQPTDQDSCHKLGSRSSISYYFHHDTADHERFLENKDGKTSFLRQYYTLVMRDITVAIRDPALYYLQFILVLFFGFLVGAVFMNTKYVIDNNLSSKSGGLLWVVFMMAYMQIFKVTQYLMMSSSIALHCIALDWICYDLVRHNMLRYIIVYVDTC
jgi:hypothetical protein